MENFNWDLSKIYKNDEEFEREYISLSESLENLKELTKDYDKNISEIFKIIDKDFMRLSKLASFAHMKFDENTKNSAGQKMQMKAFTLADDIETAISGLKPYLLTLSQDQLETLIKENNLEDYRIYLERIYRYKDHTLSKEEERIIGAFSPLGSAPRSAYGLLTDADMEFPYIESAGEKLTNANYVNLLRRPEVEIRKETFEKYYETMRTAQNAIASLQYSNVRALTILAELRNFNSAREMELFEDDVDPKVYDTLIKVVRKHLPVLHKYYKIKKDYLGLDEQHMYDVYLPMVTENAKKITFEEGKEIILEALKPMGEEYVSFVKEGFENRWIDVYPKDGKRSGAYSGGSFGTDPYILMNYTDDLNSLFTLVHELGHSLHSYYSRKNNVYINSDYTIFVAEVASTTNELLLLDHLMKNAKDDTEKFYLIDHYVDSFKSTVFRQTMFAEFEKMTHEAVENNEALTLENFNKIYYDLNKAYFGDHVISDKEIEFEWARIPHFYRNFYVYKYATGFSTAVTLSQRILNKEENALEAYLEFLSDGGKNFPIDQLKKAGADISKEETMERAMKVFESLVNELEELGKDK